MVLVQRPWQRGAATAAPARYRGPCPRGLGRSSAASHPALHGTRHASGSIHSRRVHARTRIRCSTQLVLPALRRCSHLCQQSGWICTAVRSRQPLCVVVRRRRLVASRRADILCPLAARARGLVLLLHCIPISTTSLGQRILHCIPISATSLGQRILRCPSAVAIRRVGSAACYCSQVVACSRQRRRRLIICLLLLPCRLLLRCPAP